MVSKDNYHNDNSRPKSPYHLLNPVEALPVKTKGLFK